MMAFQHPDVEPLAAGQAEDSEIAKFSADFESGFFLELAPGCGKQILVRIEDSLGYRPCALVPLRPERAAGMDEEHFPRAAVTAIEKDPRAMNRQSKPRLRCPPLATDRPLAMDFQIGLVKMPDRTLVRGGDYGRRLRKSANDRRFKTIKPSGSGWTRLRLLGQPQPTGGCQLKIGLSTRDHELRGKVGDGVSQAADFISAASSIPSLNFTPSMTFGNWF